MTVYTLNINVRIFFLFCNNYKTGILGQYNILIQLYGVDTWHLKSILMWNNKMTYSLFNCEDYTLPESGFHDSQI